jgi:hypothetical protein
LSPVRVAKSFLEKLHPAYFQGGHQVSSRPSPLHPLNDGFVAHDSLDGDQRRPNPAGFQHPLLEKNGAQVKANFERGIHLVVFIAHSVYMLTKSLHLFDSFLTCSGSFSRKVIHPA